MFVNARTRLRTGLILSYIFTILAAQNLFAEDANSKMTGRSVEPLSIVPDSSLTLEERSRANQTYSPQCHIKVVSTQHGARFGLLINSDVAFTSENIQKVLDQAKQFVDHDLCPNNDIKPRCTIKEVEDSTRSYLVSIGIEALVTYSSIESARRVVLDLRRLRICNYGSRLIVDPNTPLFQSTR